MTNTQEFPTCSTQGCLADRAYAIVDPSTKKIHRISFSASLLKHILETQHNKHLQVREISFRLGRELKPNEISSTGMYAIVKAKNNWTLRISLIKDVANHICDFDTRRLRVCIITKVH